MKDKELERTTCDLAETEQTQRKSDVENLGDENSDGENPWTTLSSRIVFETPWIRVREDRVLTPAGKPNSYGVVMFKNTAIGVLPVEEDGTTYLVGQFRYPLGSYSWEIPEGGGPLGTAPLEQARRELQEETGLRADHWETLLEMDLSNSVTNERAIIYLARGLHQGTAAPEETEVLKVKRVPLEDAFAMVERGEIRDSLTVAALLKARLLQLGGHLPRGR